MNSIESYECKKLQNKLNKTTTEYSKSYVIN